MSAAASCTENAFAFPRNASTNSGSFFTSAKAGRFWKKAKRLDPNARGAPRLLAPAAGLFLSVSARGALAALAIGPTPIGVDIEPDVAQTAPLLDVLHPREREGGAPFLALWTAKEAVVKALGAGFNIDPATLCITLQGTGFSATLDERPLLLSASATVVMRIGDTRLRAACALMRAGTK